MSHVDLFVHGFKRSIDDQVEGKKALGASTRNHVEVKVHFCEMKLELAGLVGRPRIHDWHLWTLLRLRQRDELVMDIG